MVPLLLSVLRDACGNVFAFIFLCRCLLISVCSLVVPQPGTINTSDAAKIKMLVLGECELFKMRVGVMWMEGER